jgi:hypothetical protein
MKNTAHRMKNDEYIFDEVEKKLGMCKEVCFPNMTVNLTGN